MINSACYFLIPVRKPVRTGARGLLEILLCLLIFFSFMRMINKGPGKSI